MYSVAPGMHCIQVHLTHTTHTHIHIHQTHRKHKHIRTTDYVATNVLTASSISV